MGALGQKIFEPGPLVALPHAANAVGSRPTISPSLAVAFAKQQTRIGKMHNILKLFSQHGPLKTRGRDLADQCLTKITNKNYA